jgi:hypothetical protein
MSVNNSSKEQRKPFLTLFEDGDASSSLFGLVLLLAGASFVLSSSIAPMTAAIAQEMANNNTTRQAGSVGAQSSACTPTSADGIFDEGVTVGGTSAFDDYDADTEGDGNSATTSASGTNSTTIGEEGRNQSLSEARQHIEQACLILHSGDIEGTLMQLDLALAALG